MDIEAFEVGLIVHSFSYHFPPRVNPGGFFVAFGGIIPPIPLYTMLWAV